MTPTIQVPALLGPTATGKTAIALAAAQRLNLEIISCDSRQIYRGMNIGTAKPAPADLARVRHWMIDILDPDVAYSAHAFAVEAQRIIRDAHERGKRVLIVGGTGFYYRSLSEGLGPQPAGNSALRAVYAEKARVFGADSIFHELSTVDPETARILHPRDIRRCIRALEVYHTTGRTLSELKQHTFPPRDITFHALVICLPRPLLYRRIDERVDSMAQQGLWDEFQALVSRGYGKDSPGLQCVGYQELFDVDEGRIAFQDALSKIKQNTRRFAKRQMTWFRHQIAAPHLDMTSKGASDQAIDWIEQRFQHSGQG